MSKRKAHPVEAKHHRSVEQSRRQFFRWAMRFVGGVATGVVGDEVSRLIHPTKTIGLIDKQWSRTPTESVAHRRVDLIERLLLDVGQSTDFIPPSNWPVASPDVDTGDGVFTYEHEASVLAALRFFFSDVEWRVVSDADRNVEFSHSLVFLGSGVSNYATREYLGDALAPRFEVTVPGHGGVRLPYGMAYVSNRRIERLQYNGNVVGPESAFLDSSGNVVAIPQVWESNELREDYLLVTRIPGRVFFTGLHGPGTRATELFFRGDPTILEQLEARLGDCTGRHAYYQAIFRATDLREQAGSVVATRLECMGNPCPPIRVL